MRTRSGGSSNRLPTWPTGCGGAGSIEAMEEQGPADSPLRLDAPREEALARAAKLIEQAWRSFDRFRPEEPSPVFDVLDDVARILDESIAQPRPRYFAFIGSSGLEIGAVGDALASCYDINLAVHAGAATEIENQAVRWVAEFIGYPATAGGAFTSGGTISNMTALSAARERALPGSRTDGMAGRRGAVYCSREVHYSITRAVVLVRRPDDLAAAFAHQEGYLPHQRHELHAVDITLEYSRPFRALKAWLAFRAHGAPAFREAIERNLHEARLLYEAVKAQPDFEVLGPPPQLSIVPFRHAPRGAADLNDHNARLAQAMLADGRVYLASALIDDEVYLRPCFVNFRTTEEDVLAIIDVARELGDRLARGG